MIHDYSPMTLVNPRIYGVFRQELDKSLADATGVLKDVETLPEESKIKDLGRNFHTIRGGAGFLGFSEVAGAAAEMEALLLKSSAEMEAKLAEARKVLDRFTAAVAGLPKPEA